MTERTVTIYGPLSDEDLHEIFLLVQKIEGRAPHNTYGVVVNDPDSKQAVAETIELMEKLNPRREGYERTIGFERRGKKN